jgi:cGMP-dependent protein kinase
MFYCDVNEGDYVYENTSMGHCFFIVEKGILDMLVNDKLKKELKPQDGFGELALLYNTQRSCSVVARESSSLWVIDRKTFREAVEEVIIRDYSENRKCLEGIRFFMNLTNDQKDIIASALLTQKFYKNQTIIQEGDPGSTLYYIKEGFASVYKGNKFVRKISKGDSFGEQSLYYNTMRQLTIKADDEVTCLVLGRDTLNRILSDKIYDITFKNFIKWAF